LRDQGTSVRFEIVGGGLESQKLMDRAAREVPELVRVHTYRHPAEMEQVFAEADAVLVHLRRDPLFEITIPSKTQAYLAVGKPILMGVRGDAANLVEEARAGILFLPESPASLATAVKQMMALSADERDRMGANGAKYYDTRLAFDVGIAKIEQELLKAVKR
jgi:colanic acid biosynthesis glycosyl transferase WcaI